MSIVVFFISVVICIFVALAGLFAYKKQENIIGRIIGGTAFLFGILCAIITALYYFLK